MSKVYVNIKVDEDLQTKLDETVVFLGGEFAVHLKWPQKLRLICDEILKDKEKEEEKEEK